MTHKRLETRGRPTLPYSNDEVFFSMVRILYYDVYYDRFQRLLYFVLEYWGVSSDAAKRRLRDYITQYKPIIVLLMETHVLFSQVKQ